MEKQPTGHKATGAPVNNLAGDGLDRDRAYDTGFKYQIPEADTQQQPNHSSQSQSQYQHHDSYGNDGPKADMGERIGSGVRGAFAAVHGAGEWLRGGINAAVDRTFGSEDGVTRNEAISRAGQEEMRSGRFSHDTQGGWKK
ncbi:hypothetical protein BDW66DRAFT_124174 [Aspergillus desertorum]